MTRRVPGLSERWADQQLDLLDELEPWDTDGTPCPRCGGDAGHAAGCTWTAAAGLEDDDETTTEARA